MKGIVLVRHGETATPGLFLGSSDPPLSEAGRRQAQRIAESLPAPDRLMSSQLLRAAETAAILGDIWGIEPIADARLNEISYGLWDGLAWAEIERRWLAEAAAKLESWWDATPPGGESSQSFVERLRAAWKDVRSSRGRVVIVAHVGVNAVLAELARDSMGAGLDWDRITRFTQALGDWIEL